MTPDERTVSVPVDSRISFTLTQPVEFVDLSLSPPVAFARRAEQMSGTIASASTRMIFEPVVDMAPGTRYVVTLTWGTDPADAEGLQTLTWAFTTLNLS